MCKLMKLSQSPPPPTSSAVLPNWDNLNSNKQTEFVGDIKGTDFQYSFIGPEFDSTQWYDCAQKLISFHLELPANHTKQRLVLMLQSPCSKITQA